MALRMALRTCDFLHQQHGGVVVDMVLHLGQMRHHDHAAGNLGRRNDLPGAQLGGRT